MINTHIKTSFHFRVHSNIKINMEMRVSKLNGYFILGWVKMSSFYDIEKYSSIKKGFLNKRDCRKTFQVSYSSVK